MNKKNILIGIVIIFIGYYLGYFLTNLRYSSLIPSDSKLKTTEDYLYAPFPKKIAGELSEKSDYYFFDKEISKNKHIAGFINRSEIFFIPEVLRKKMNDLNIFSEIKISNKGNIILSGSNILNFNTKDYSCISENKIYEYNPNSFELKEIFKENSVNNGIENIINSNTVKRCRALNIIGSSGSRLILKSTNPELVYKDCEYKWSGDTSRYFSLELADNEKQLKPYNPPQYLMDRDNQKSKECVNSYN